MEKEALLYNLEEKIAELEEVNNALLSREEELVALNKISVESNPSLDLQETLERTLDVVLSSMGLETGFIFLLDEARGEFVLKAQQGMRGQFARELVTMKAGYDFPAVAPELESLIRGTGDFRIPSARQVPAGQRGASLPSPSVGKPSRGQGWDCTVVISS